MDLGLKGKIALLTGASRGLGFATAETLAREGAHIAINSRSPGKTGRPGGGSPDPAGGCDRPHHAGAPGE
jgi:NAD(P)-dependent dehydrogenase (short-subunit alcohol dehydrogenase family)